MFYFIEVQNLNDGTLAQAIYAKDSLNEAIAAFHSSLAYAAQSTNVDKCLCVVMNDRGLIYYNELWEKNLEYNQSK